MRLNPGCGSYCWIPSIPRIFHVHHPSLPSCRPVRREIWWQQLRFGGRDRPRWVLRLPSKWQSCTKQLMKSVKWFRNQTRGFIFLVKLSFWYHSKKPFTCLENGAVCSDDCNVCPVVFLAVIWHVCVCVCVCIIIHPSKLLVNVANFKNFVKLKKNKHYSVSFL